MPRKWTPRDPHSEYFQVTEPEARWLAWQPERFVSMICLMCLGDPEHIKTHEDYGRAWIPDPEELDEPGSA